MTWQPQRPRRILFALASPEYLRYYDSTLRLLADRGHQVILAVNQMRERKAARLDLVDDSRITVAGVVPERGDPWQALARGVRGTIDFVRYLHPRFAETPLLRERMYRKYLPALMQPLNRIRSLDEAWLRRVIGGLQAIERAVPISRRVTEFLAEHRPDIVVVSPLIDGASDQVDLLRAAQSIGVPVVAAIASWDNLTNKGLMRVEPDLVTVWNEHQKAEAIQLHGVRPERIAVTGAQLFDRWFERTLSQDRQAFCASVGLPDDRPFVLFTGSSVFIARSTVEVPFVRQWIEALRASADPALRDLAVLVRPHPFNPDAWITADFSDLGPVAIWPRRRYTPASEDARDSFYDSLSHADAVVGINTSAMIEAAILRKPVLSLLTPQFAGTQEGTIHFRYLLPEHGGFLRVANSIDTHVEQLREVLADPETVRQQTEGFVGRFLRPNGLANPCTPILADTIESAGVRRALETDRAGARLLRLLLWPIVFAADWLSRREGQPRRKRRDGAISTLLATPARWGRAVPKRLRTLQKRIHAAQKVVQKRLVWLGKGPRKWLTQLAKRSRSLLPKRFPLSPRGARTALKSLSRAWRIGVQRLRRGARTMARTLRPTHGMRWVRRSVVSGLVQFRRATLRRLTDALGITGLRKRIRSQSRSAVNRLRRHWASQVAELGKAGRRMLRRARHVAGRWRHVRRLPGRALQSTVRMLRRTAMARFFRYVRSLVRRARYEFGVWRRGGAEMAPRPAAPDGPERPLRVLFAIRNFLFLRLFEPVVRELAARGHQVHLLADGDQQPWSDEEQRAVEQLESEFPNVSHTWAPQDIEDDWFDLRLYVRYGLDYLRYLGDAYRDSPILAARAVDRTPKAVVEWSRRRFWRARPGRWLMTAGFRVVERAAPVDGVLAHSLLAYQPDVLLVTPLIWLGSEQQDMIRVARRHGVPSALCVASWDNLSSKALVRTIPDRVFVWNDVQRAEAVRYHQVPAHRVVVTGAQCFDRWFARSPAEDREMFCRRVGLDPARPTVVYTCSALFEGSPAEPPFIARWVEALRTHRDPVLADANILIRPHPRRSAEWQDVDPTTLHGAVVWPPRGVTPLDAETRADYFDSLHHATAVVGLNTTAMIEAGVIGRPVYTVLLPEFRDNQEGTLHFPYLLEGGLIVAARDLDSHLDQVAASLGPAAEHPQLRGFVERFVRPQGIDVAATPFFIGEVEALGLQAPTPQAEPWWTPAVRRLLEPTALAMTGTFAGKVARVRRKLDAERAREQRLEERRREMERLLAARELRRRAQAAITREKQQRREARRAARALRQAEKHRQREIDRAADVAANLARRAARQEERVRQREAAQATRLASRAAQQAEKERQRQMRLRAQAALRREKEREKQQQREAILADRAARQVERQRQREAGRAAVVAASLARRAEHRAEKARRREASQATRLAARAARQAEKDRQREALKAAALATRMAARSARRESRRAEKDRLRAAARAADLAASNPSAPAGATVPEPTDRDSK